MIRPKRDRELTVSEHRLIDRIEELEDILHVLVMGLNTIHSGDHLNGGARMMLAAMARATLNKGQ